MPKNNSHFHARILATRVTLTTMTINLILSVCKLLTGILAGSNAMVSDGINDVSDVFSSIVVLIGMRISSKDPDEKHPYGHERMECVAAILLSAVLFGTGAGIAIDSIQNIFDSSGTDSHVPGISALVVAAISIMIKEGMFRYTRYYAKKTNSCALLADAWHHRTDALSSLGALLGILGARMGILILDSVASFIIFALIVKAAYDIFKDAVNKMIDRSCDDETETALRNFITEFHGILGIDLLRTRMFGNRIYVELEIQVNAKKTLEEAHEIAENLHLSIEAAFPAVKHIMIHCNPK